MSGYDRAITVFSPDGHLFQVRKSPTNISCGKASDEGGVLTIITFKVEYAQEAVKKGSTAVGVSGAHIDSVVD